MKLKVEEVLIGKIQKYGPKGQLSGYKKTAACGVLAIGTLGLEGDEQADLKNHGGTDKAILHYSFDHYKKWRREQPDLRHELTKPGAFGENISTLGIDETGICIGDKYRLGTAIVEVSQGRQPCWKLGHRFDKAFMVKEVIQTARCGWYYRVLQTGAIQRGEYFEFLERPCPQWSVAEVSKHLNSKNPNQQILAELAALEFLAQEWRQKAAKLLAKIGN